MNLLVCLSASPETTAKIAFSADGTEYDENGVQLILNPYDEWYALVRAIEIKESHGAAVDVIHVGPASNDILIRKALALGADQAFRVNSETQSSLLVAKQIGEFAKEKQYDIIFCGKETINHNGSEVPSMLAEILDLPFVSYATELQITNDQATATRDVDGSFEKINLNFPFVISAAKGLASQRIAKMKDIMMSRRKPLTVLDSINQANKTELIQFSLPAPKKGVKMIDPDRMSELVKMLNQEAKVI